MEIEEVDLSGTDEKLKDKRKPISDWILVGSITIIILIGAVIFSVRFFADEEPKTIDDLHKLNLAGKLKDEQGYLYNGYSFVLANGLWYTQVQTIGGENQFDIPLHFGPDDVKDIPVEGALNTTKFDAERSIYITFDPLGQNLNYVALAVGEFDQSIIKAFNKLPVAACDKNETSACQNRPIVVCNSTEKPILYLQQEETPKVIYDDNCIIVQGTGPGIVKSVDRLLLKLYGIMP
ncbi:MAG TPA: hypothetical protein VFF28_00580 [Candidatus Nanoarchaeia archaeon]|nr:hypothetical protein [Candidatus Nanoarchaeia archaeon]